MYLMNGISISAKYQKLTVNYKANFIKRKLLTSFFLTLLFNSTLIKNTIANENIKSIYHLA